MSNFSKPYKTITYLMGNDYLQRKRTILLMEITSIYIWIRILT